MQTNDIFREIEDFSHMVVSTSLADRPEAATVGFSYDKDRNEIYFGSELHTRKMRNIQHNNQIALVFSTSQLGIQIEGEAGVADGEAVGRIKALHVKRNPFAAQYADLPDQRYVIIKPRWARFTDYREGELVQEVEWE